MEGAYAALQELLSTGCCFNFISDTETASSSSS